LEQLVPKLMLVSVSFDAGAVAVNPVPAAVPLLVHVLADAAEADVSADRASTSKTTALKGFLDMTRLLGSRLLDRK
jgi:hypothetical protein